jgi:hypothetical protein
MPVETLPQFYELMYTTIPARRALTEEMLASRPASPEAIGRLREALSGLQAIPEEPAGRRLALDGSRSIHVDLSYEIEGLERDLVFLEKGESALLAGFAERRAGFREEVAAAVDALGGTSFQAFVTDRDGTVNNYCGRYSSSVQSVYSAVFLARFARERSKGSVILTSAPLDAIGLADMAVTPPGVLICAGSKGREYFDAEGRRRQYPIEPVKQEKLDTLNRELDRLLKVSGNEIFTLIGSGLQHKFGQTTIARQDITGSIPPEESERFLGDVVGLVRSLDPDEVSFRIEDTSLDIELLLTVDDESGAGTRDFDKGDGVRFLNEDLGLEMDRGPCLVCGDTGSDVPMLTASLELARETRAVFVTDKEELRGKVKDAVPETLFVGEPDTLVAILNALGGGGRP